MRVLVYGALPQQPNRGVEALAEGARAVLLRAFPQAEVLFRFTGPEGDGPVNLSHTSAFLKAAVSHRGALQKWTRSLDLVCDIRGGDSFTDIYSVKYLFKLSAFPLYALFQRRPVVLLPQTVGPFEHLVSRLLAKAYLKRCALVMTRDPKSAAVATDMGCRVDLAATDLVFAIEMPSGVQPGEHDVIINPSGLLWHENRHADARTYREGLRLVIRELLSRGRAVTLLAHVVGTGDVGRDNDRAALAGLREEFGDRIRYEAPATLAETRQLIASASVVVGARMHACLNALSMGVPAVPMAYSRKFAPLLTDLGWAHTVEIEGTAQGLAEQVLRHIDAVTPEDVQPVVEEAHRRIDQVVAALQGLGLSRR